MADTVSVKKADLRKLRDYAQYHDSVDALKLIDKLLKE